MNKHLIVLLGPTGVGKTDISIDLAAYLNCEIISSDSRQFYREMKIGTAVPGEKQLSRVKHHFIGFLSVNDYYSASLYERDALRVIDDLFTRNDTAIMAGGSGMYIDAVCSGIDDIPDVDPAVREKYLRKYREDGIESLRIELRLRDPLYYEITDLRNPKRIIRALEICETTGLPYSSFLAGRKNPRNFNILKIGLERPRSELYERINRRVDEMIEKGLETEARELFKFRHLNALNSVGYKELFGYFEDRISKDEAIALIKRNSRRYAKRQMTWWARDKEITWFSPDDSGGIVKFIEEKIGGSVIGD